MQHEILLRPSYSALRCVLKNKECVWTETGAMLAMDPSVKIEGTMQGGAWKALKRVLLSNESFFVTSITATEDDTEVLLAPRAVGDIEIVPMENEEYLVQGGCFLASTDGIKTDSKFTGWQGFLSGEGIFMVQAQGTGTLFISSFGGILKKEIAAGKKFVVDNGHIVAFSKKMPFTMEKVGDGLLNMVTTGEGLACVFTGPGFVYLQTRNLKTFAETLNPFLQQRDQTQKSGILGGIMG